MSSTNLYQWEPLSDGEDTRVVQILPASSFDDPVRCNILNISLKNPPRYRTVSYAWGPTYPDGSHLSDTIHCDQQPMQVTRTLYMALKRLREDQTTWYRKLPIWIDAISINQRDPVEKARQVLMMSNIFENSRHLTVWLGETTTAQEARGCEEISKKFWEWETGENAPEISLETHERSLLHNILDRWWFRRRWIIQEVLVSHTAGRTPFFRLGKAGWNWPFFIYIVEQLDGGHEVDRFLLLAKRVTNDTNLLGPFIVKMLSPLLGSPNRSMSNSLLETLHIFDHAECYDPRDKLFSLLSIGWGLSQPGSLAVDYEESVESVYENFATSSIQSSDNDFFEQVLASASCRPNYKTSCVCPSWVPDWRLPITYHSVKHRKAVERTLRTSAYDKDSIIVSRNHWFIVQSKIVVKCLLIRPTQHSLYSLRSEVQQKLDVAKKATCNHPKGANETICDRCEDGTEILAGILHEIEALGSNEDICLILDLNIAFMVRPIRGKTPESLECFVLGHCFLVENYSDILGGFIREFLEKFDLTQITIV